MVKEKIILNTMGSIVPEIEEGASMTEAGLGGQDVDLLQLGEKYRDQGKRTEMTELIIRARTLINSLSKAKAAKLVRGLVDLFLGMREDGDEGQKEVDLCKDCIEWAKEEKRLFLRQSLEARLIGLYYETERYKHALELGTILLKELKKMDDKNLLVEVQLIESKTYHALGNLSKARAALTSARTTATSIYVAPNVQAELDMQSGILHASEERDFKTAFSYFYESFEQYDSCNDKKAVVALKYMLMAKIMLNSSDEVQSLLSGKLALKYSGPEIEAMKGIAKASKNRSLSQFQETLKIYPKEITEDKIVAKHLDSLYQSMLEQNLARIIEPYSRVEVSFIASRISLPKGEVEKKLSQMILDKKIEAILDQDLGVLVIFDCKSRQETFDNIVLTIDSMSKVVDRLYHSARKIN